MRAAMATCSASHSMRLEALSQTTSNSPIWGSDARCLAPNLRQPCLLSCTTATTVGRTERAASTADALTKLLAALSVESAPAVNVESDPEMPVLDSGSDKSSDEGYLTSYTTDNE